MTKANNKSDPIRAKIAKSEAQLQNNDALPATRLPDAAPPEKFSNLISDYPGLAIAAGLGLGLLAGALLPRSTGRKLLRGGVFVASTATELGLAFGKQAVRKADDATRDGREILGETAAKAGRVASDAGRKAAEADAKPWMWVVMPAPALSAWPKTPPSMHATWGLVSRRLHSQQHRACASDSRHCSLIAAVAKVLPGFSSLPGKL
jgi:hypothetical protein